MASYEIDSTRELVALGFTNIGGSLIMTLPALGSLSRSALNASGGTKTQLSGLVRVPMRKREGRIQVWWPSHCWRLSEAVARV